jgi:phosphoglycerate dehydrogenase-like enzyme
MSISVHVASTDQAFLAHLTLLLSPDVDITTGSGDEAPPRATRILVKGVPTRADLAACPHLEIVIIPWSGFPRASRELLSDQPQIAVHNLHHNADTVAEMAIGLMFACAKHVPLFDRRLRRGDWQPRYAESQVTLLKEKRTLVLGYGAIGQRIAVLCKALGMSVTGLRRSDTTAVDSSIPIVGADRLLSLIPETEVLFISLPETPETEGLIGARELGQLPQGAIVVNIGRGTIIDEAALYRALRDKRISAGLDVWYNYPRSDTDRMHTQPSQYPFAGLDNVVMTPHLAGHNTHIEKARAVELARLLNAAARGDALPNRVTIERGY